MAKPKRTVREASIEHLSKITHYEDSAKRSGPNNIVPEGTPKARSVGMPYAEILALIHAEFPHRETTVECLRWYAVKMRNPLGEDEIYSSAKLPQRRPRVVTRT